MSRELYPKKSSEEVLNEIGKGIYGSPSQERLLQFLINELESIGYETSFIDMRRLKIKEKNWGTACYHRETHEGYEEYGATIQETLFSILLKIE